MKTTTELIQKHMADEFNYHLWRWWGIPLTPLWFWAIQQEEEDHEVK